MKNWMRGLMLIVACIAISAIGYSFVGPVGLAAGYAFGESYMRFAQWQVYGTSLLTNPDVSALAAYAGTYEKALIRKMVDGLEFLKHVTSVPNVKSKLNLTKLSITANVRPFLTAEQMEATLAYTPRVLTLGRGKSELPINLVEYRDSWMVELANRNITAFELPFAQYVWEHYVEQVGTELNNRTFYYGFDKTDAVTFDASDTYAAGDYITYTISGILHYYKCLATTTAGQDPEDTPAKWQRVNAEAVFEGLESILTNDANVEEISTGAVTTPATALAACRELAWSFDPKYKAMQKQLFCSYTDWEWLIQGVEDKLYQGSTQDASAGFMWLPGTNRTVQVIPVSWLQSSRRLICSAKNNILFGHNTIGDYSAIEVVKSDLWAIKAGLTFEGGVQIRDVDGIKIGDQA